MSDHHEVAMSPDPASFRTVMGHFATGVTIITATDEGVPLGVAANSFTSVSLDPPLVSFCASKQSSTWPRIRGAGRYCINILGEDQEDVCRVFASPGVDRFAQVGHRPSGVTHSPLLEGTIAYADCETEQEVDAGDHIIVIARVLELGVLRSTPPLLFYRGGYGGFHA